MPLLRSPKRDVTSNVQRVRLVLWTGPPVNTRHTRQRGDRDHQSDVFGGHEPTH